MLSIGEELHGRYKIEALLGEGGMGAVYRASDWLEDGRLCAVKEFRLGQLPSESELDEKFRDATYLHSTPLPLSREQALEQFRREAKLLKQLDHPNLPKVFDYFTLGSEAYIVMTLIEGQDLVEVLKANDDRPLEESVIRSILEQILSALRYCHEHHVIHRDIKPDNILLSKDGKAYLVDFGIAKDTTVSTNTTTIAARAQTPGYAPPEQGGFSRTDERSDIYSLGATIYSLCTGQTPITALDRSSGISLPPISSINPIISPELCFMVEHCMKLDRNERIQNIEEILQVVSAKPDQHGSERQPDLTAPQIQIPSPKNINQDQTISVTKHVKNQLFPLGARVWIGLGSTLILALMTLLFIIKPFSGYSPKATITLQASPSAVVQQVSSTLSAVANTATTDPSPTLETSPKLQNSPSSTPSYTRTPSPTFPPATATLEITLRSQVINPDNVSSLVVEVVPWKFTKINDVAFSPDGQTLAISSYGSIMLYKGSKYDRVNIPAYSSQVAFSPDGKTLITYEGNGIVFRDLATLQITNTCKINPAEIKRMAVFPDGSWVAATGYYLTPYIALCTYSNPTPVRYFEGISPFTSVAAMGSDTERTLIAGSANTIYYWKNVNALIGSNGAEVLKYTNYNVVDLDFLDSHSIVVSTIEGCETWNLINGQLITQTTKFWTYYGYNDDIEAADNGTLIIIPDYGKIDFLTSQLESIYTFINGTSETVEYRAITISPDESIIAVSDDQGYVSIFHLPTP